MYVVPTKLDNECYRNVKNKKINVDYKFGTFSWKR